MILTCPSCGTQYVVQDGAIPPDGRQVRCAACKHSWHQDPEAAADSEAGIANEVPTEEPATDDRDDETLAEATLVEPRSGPEAEERAYEEAQIDEGNQPLEETGEDADTPAATTYANSPFDMQKHDEQAPSDFDEPPGAEAEDDEFTPFPPADEGIPPARRPLLSILIVVIIVIAIAAAFWFLAPPAFKARLGLAGISATPLALVTTHMDRQRLESGNELLTVTGRVINPTGKEQDVPPLRAQLKTRTGKIVYSWTIAPPAHSLAPGASASFNSAEVNVPPGGDELTITLGTEAG